MPKSLSVYRQANTAETPKWQVARDLYAKQLADLLQSPSATQRLVLIDDNNHYRHGCFWHLQAQEDFSFSAPIHPWGNRSMRAAYYRLARLHGSAYVQWHLPCTLVRLPCLFYVTH